MIKSATGAEKYGKTPAGFRKIKGGFPLDIERGLASTLYFGRADPDPAV